MSPSALIFTRLLRHSLRQPAVAYILPIGMPLGLLVFISQLYGALLDSGGYPVTEMIEWMGPGIVFLAVCMGGGFSSSVLAHDLDSGLSDRLSLLGVRPRHLVGGALAFDAFRIVPVGAVLYLAAVAIGMPRPGVGTIAITLALAAAWSAAWNALFVYAAVRTGNTQLPVVLLPIFLPFFLGSTMMVPRDLLPEYVQAIIDANPLDRFVIAVRPLFLGDGFAAAETFTALGLAAVLVALAGGFAVRYLERVRTL